jgi:hypothetical protein
VTLHELLFHNITSSKQKALGIAHIVVEKQHLLNTAILPTARWTACRPPITGPMHNEVPSDQRKRRGIGSGESACWASLGCFGGRPCHGLD